MPTYLFKNEDTEEITEIFLSINQLDEYKKENPRLTRVHNSVPPMIRTSAKPDNGFRDVLKRIKSANRGANINTF